MNKDFGLHKGILDLVVHIFEVIKFPRLSAPLAVMTASVVTPRSSGLHNSLFSRISSCFFFIGSFLSAWQQTFYRLFSSPSENKHTRQKSNRSFSAALCCDTALFFLILSNLPDIWRNFHTNFVHFEAFDSLLPLWSNLHFCYWMKVAFALQRGDRNILALTRVNRGHADVSFQFLMFQTALNLSSFGL